MKIRWSLFPKFYRHLSHAQLADLVLSVGLDTTNLVIRDGYWCAKATLAQDAPRFLGAMRAAGLEVRFATAGFTADEIFADESPLAILAENGIREWRMGYFRAPDADVRAALADARAKMERLAAVCERVGIRAVYQVHHGTIIPGPSAAYSLVQGLPSRYIGVELDPGNQTFEGAENWGRSAHLLGEYLVAVGVKDSTLVRDPVRADEPNKGWKRSWTTLDAGVTNWTDLARALQAVHFDGTFVYMPFYDEHDPDTMTAKLRRDVAYLRQVVRFVSDDSDQQNKGAVA